MTGKAAFLNRIRSLYNIDHYLLPELSDQDWREFRQNPPRYLIHTDKAQSDAIWREIEKRQTPRGWSREEHDRELALENAKAILTEAKARGWK